MVVNVRKGRALYGVPGLWERTRQTRLTEVR